MPSSENRRRCHVRPALIGLLSLCLVLVGGPALAYDPPAESPFSDVAVTDPAYTEIAWMKDSGVSTGWPDGTYRPKQQVDRDAMAAFFYRYKGSPQFSPPATSPFTDITPTIQFYKEMSWMKATGISTGWPDGTYRPWETTYRDAMSAFMYRFAGEPAYTPPATSPFTDISPSIQFYKEMMWMAETGIANNIEDGTFDPFEPVTREMMAVFMYRLANPQGPVALTIQTSSLPDAVLAVPYSTSVQASGGSTPYEWTATGLPAGLTLSPAGEISGTPTASGQVSVSLTVTDAASGTASKTLTLNVKAAANPLAITTTSLAQGVVGSAYSASLAAKDGVAPYTWTASGLPAGLSISADGKITGTPTAVGNTVITVQVQDSQSTTVQKNLNLVVVSTLSITTPTPLPTGVVSTAYSATLSAQGGVKPYQWSATGLPAGLSVSDGKITGTPSKAGTSQVTVQVTDAYNSQVSKTLSLTISAANNCAVLRCIAITIDDGPQGYSDSLLNTFSNAGAKATFFDVGANVAANPAAVARKANAGMEIGIHGWNHVYYTSYGYNYQLYDFDAAAEAVQRATGDWPTLFRPPYGYYDQNTVNAAGALGMATVLWTDDTWDWEYTSASQATQLRRDTVDLASRNAVLLMHDGPPATAAAMPGIIADLQAQGYTLVTVTMLNGGTLTPGRVYWPN